MDPSTCCGAVRVWEGNLSAESVPVYGQIENDFIFQNDSIYKNYIGLYRRFPDDVFIIWMGSEELLVQFGQYIYNPSLGFGYYG